MLKTKKAILLLIIFFSAVFVLNTNKALAASPVLNFSDIVSGPKLGLSDGLGQGTIVTIWGNKLGSTQGASRVFFRDSAGVSREAAYVYYWKNADGQLPGGPADLYSYHKMQEIAFSIPSASTDGLGSVYVEVDGVNSNALPFTIRAGSIFFVKPTGTNGSGANGSWSTPWRTLNYAAQGAGGRITAGSVIYATGLTETSADGSDAIQYTRISGVSLSSPVSIIAYPNSAVVAIGGNRSVIINWYGLGQYWNFSKLSLRSNGAEGIWTSLQGRIVGLEITENGSHCSDGWGGAIAGNDGIADYGYHTYMGSGPKALGNYIHDFGCDSSTTGHHVFYITNRGGIPFLSYELGWNYLRDNKVNSALHVYDQIPGGDWIGDMNIHDNVVLNQRGYAFDLLGDGPITMPVNVYNNLFINDGLGPALNPNIFYDAIHVSEAGVTSQVNIYHNTIYGYGESSLGSGVNINHGGTFNYRNNLVVDTKMRPFSGSAKSGTSVSNNLWYGVAGGLALPSWDISALTSNPMLSNPSAGDFTLQASSPARNAGAYVGVDRDFYGNLRDANPDIGAFEYEGSGPAPDTTPPAAPSGIVVN